MLLHGLFSDAKMNWIKFGHAERIAARGLSRDHARPARAWAERQAAWGRILSAGILARDLRELVALLGLTDFDLGGFSLGARTTVEGGGRGPAAAPGYSGRCGLEGLRNWKRRKTFFLDAIAMFDQVQRGDPHWLSIQFMKSQKVDRVAAALLLESFEDAFMDWLQAFTMPTLVVCGERG